MNDQAKDFLCHGFQQDPEKRWTAAQMLDHPFIESSKCIQSDEMLQVLKTVFVSTSMQLVGL